MAQRPRWMRIGGDRKRVLLLGAATVIVLALVILGISALSSPNDSGKKPDQQASTNNGPSESAAEESRRLLELAREAKRSGDTTTAADLAQQAVDANPGNSDARDLLDSLTDDATPDSGSQGGTGTVPVVPNVSDPAKLLPATITGYSFGVVVSDSKDAVVSADPMKGTQDFSSVNHVLFAVHDRGSEATAREFVDGVHKRVYGTDRAQVAVAGGFGYFGTDGGRLACVAFYRGKYAFELVITGQNVAPLALKDTAIRLASAYRISL